MDAKDIKTHITHLERAKDDRTILEILNTLKRDIKPTEKLLRVSVFAIYVRWHN